MQGAGGRDPAAQTRKVFIGGLNYSTEEDAVKEYFCKFGEIVDVIVMRFPDTKRSRGFGFVTFATDEGVDTCQSSRPHIIDEKEVETKRATPRESRDNPESGKSVRKVFVGGVPEEVTEDEIRTYFEQFGSVQSVTRATDKESGRPKRFCFVEFDDYDPVDKAIIQGNHELGGRHVDVKKAVSNTSLAAGGRGSRGFNRGGRGGGGWGGQYGGGHQGGWGGFQAGGAAGGAVSGWGGYQGGAAGADYAGYQAGGAADWSSYGTQGYDQSSYGGGPMRTGAALTGYRTAPYGGGNAAPGSRGGYRGGM